jgi:phage tail-like protein
VRSPPGRYLWLALTLRGDGHATPCIESIALEFPRITLRRYLPAVFGFDAAGADFTDRFTAVFDATLRSIERVLDREAMLFDPLSAPAVRRKGASIDFLAWLASWVGITLAQEWPEPRRRRYFRAATRLYCLRGTYLGLWRQLLLLLGFDRAYDACLDERPKTRCVPRPRNCGPEPPRARAEPPPLILEHYRLRRWLHAGCARLGDDAVLWGKRIVNRSELSGERPPPNQTGNARVGETQLKGVPDPFHDPFLVYAHRFSVFVPARVRACDPERRAFERLLARETPAHAAYDIQYVEPRFRVGVQAMIGLDSVVARTPRGVTLTSAPLGQGTVLSAPPNRRDGPRLAVGDARVGSTTLIA